MTSFFLGGTAEEDPGTERAYTALRERSDEAAGCPARQRRIFSLSCRYAGRDCDIEVGKPLADGGDVVVAILDHGRFAPFHVHVDDGGSGAPALVGDVYSVTEFS